MTMHPAELNEINPCRSCSERCVGCHSVCGRRREWLANGRSAKTANTSSALRTVRTRTLKTSGCTK